VLPVWQLIILGTVRTHEAGVRSVNTNTVDSVDAHLADQRFGDFSEPRIVTIYDNCLFVRFPTPEIHIWCDLARAINLICIVLYCERLPCNLLTYLLSKLMWSAYYLNTTTDVSVCRNVAC